MISQYQINNDLVDTTNTPYPSMYMQNNQNGQNQSGNSNSPQDPSTTQSPWDEATNQSFLSNNSYLSFRQQIPPSRTQLPSGPNSYHSQFSGSSQTQQKFANYIAQQNYYYQNQNSNPSPIAQIVTYPQQLSSIQQQIHSSSSSNQKYPAMYSSPSTNANYSLPIQQQNMPSNQSKFYCNLL